MAETYDGTAEQEAAAAVYAQIAADRVAAVDAIRKDVNATRGLLENLIGALHTLLPLLPNLVASDPKAATTDWEKSFSSVSPVDLP